LLLKVTFNVFSQSLKLGWANRKKMKNWDFDGLTDGPHYRTIEKHQ
jgi:hypothetical protein